MEYNSILINIRKIVRALNLESKRILKEFGVSIPQILCLGYLSEQEGYKATHKDVANYLNLNSSTVTGIITRLEKKGFVARLPKMGDKRITYIALTSKGFRVLENTPGLLHDLLTSKLPELAPDTLTQIDKSLEILINCLGIEKTEASPVFTIDEPI
jgi:DNA-binding MarR family transcriptional regulator